MLIHQFYRGSQRRKIEMLAKVRIEHMLLFTIGAHFCCILIFKIVIDPNSCRGPGGDFL